MAEIKNPAFCEAGFTYFDWVKLYSELHFNSSAFIAKYNHIG